MLASDRARLRRLGLGQLGHELAAGTRFVVEPDEALLFDQETETKWQRAFDRRGIDL